MDYSAEQVWLIDTNYSYIDSIAFDYLLRKLNIAAITLVGTAHRSVSSAKISLQSHISAVNPNLSIPIYEGSNIPFINYQVQLGDDPIVNPYEISAPSNSQGEVQQQINIQNVAAVKIIELANTLGKKLNILTLGPLTNLAIAVLIDASIATKINSLVISGGSVNNWGNSGNAAEFNFRHDPVSAKNVIKHFPTKTVIPLEIDRELSPKIFNSVTVGNLQNKDLAAKFQQVIDHLVEEGKKTEFTLVNFNTLSVFAALYAINPKALSVSVSYPTDVDIIGKLTRGILVMEKYLHVQEGKLVPTTYATFFDEKVVQEMILN